MTPQSALEYSHLADKLLNPDEREPKPEIDPEDAIRDITLGKDGEDIVGEFWGEASLKEIRELRTLLVVSGRDCNAIGQLIESVYDRHALACARHRGVNV